MNIDLEGWDLHRAASKNMINIAAELIASGYDVKAKYKDSQRSCCPIPKLRSKSLA
jgi:hypothetical protein